MVKFFFGWVENIVENEEMLLTRISSFSHIFFYFFFFFFKPFPKRQILDFSKLKEFADDNFEIHENGRKFVKWVENTVGKGEIACSEQFLLFPRSFLKTYTADT